MNEDQQHNCIQENRPKQVASQQEVPQIASSNNSQIHSYSDNKSDLQNNQVSLQEISRGNGSLILKTSQDSILKCIPHRYKKKHVQQCAFLQNEYLILQKLNHPNIVEIQQYKQSLKTNWQQKGECCCILMKKYDFDLFDKYLTLKYKVDDQRDVFRGLIEGLNHIHENGYAHNDIKPENIFYDKTSQTGVIGDFGLAGLNENKTFKETKLEWKNRELTYCAPEINLLRESSSEQQFSESYQKIFLANINQDQMIDEEEEQNISFNLDFQKNDIYSMGMVMFVSIFRTLPNLSFSNLQKGTKKDGQKVDFWENLERKCKKIENQQFLLEACEVMKQMIAFNPEKRPNCSQILQSPFFLIK